MTGKNEKVVCNTKESPEMEEPTIKGRELTQVLLQMFKKQQPKEVKND